MLFLVKDFHLHKEEVSIRESFWVKYECQQRTVAYRYLKADTPERREADSRAYTWGLQDQHKILGGGTYTLNQIVPKENIQLTKGKLNSYTYYGDSGTYPSYPKTPTMSIFHLHPLNKYTNTFPTGKAVNCYYCPNCTTHVYHHQTVMGDKVVVRTILLEKGKDFQPGAEIYGKARLPWEKEVAHTFETLPPSWAYWKGENRWDSSIR